MSVGCNCRDANLWRPKIGRLSFFYPSPRNSPPPNDVHTIEIRMLEKIFVNDKNAPETVLRIRKIQERAKNGLNLKPSLFYFLPSIQYL